MISFRRVGPLSLVLIIALLLMPAGSVAQKTKTDADMVEMQNYILTTDKGRPAWRCDTRCRAIGTEESAGSFFD